MSAGSVTAAMTRTGPAHRGQRIQGAVGSGLPGDTNFGGTSTVNTSGNENLIVNLPIGNPASAIKFEVVSIPDFILQLELQALQLEGRAEVISNPRVVTAN